MPVHPTLLERLAMYRLKIAPLPLLDVFGAYSFRVLTTGLRLGVFDELAEGPLDSDSLSARIGVTAESTVVLLDALASIGYVERRSDGWANSSATSRWLVAKGGSGVRSGVEYWARLLDGPLSELEGRLKGDPGRPLYEWLARDDETSALFQEWMVEIAGLAGDEIIGKVSIPEARHLLDVGGGHGWYSIGLCRKHPGLEATIIDYPGATRDTRRRIVEADLGGRIQVVNGDYMTHRFDRAFDVVLLFNILHGHRNDQMVSLLERTRDWLEPGGRVLVVEQFSLKSGMAGTSSALLALAYDQVLHGKSHTYEAVQKALRQAGFAEMRRRKLIRVPGTSLIEARTARAA